MLAFSSAWRRFCSGCCTAPPPASPSSPLSILLAIPSRTHDDELSAELWFMAFPMFFLHFLLVAKLIYIYIYIWNEYFNFHLGQHPPPQAASRAQFLETRLVL